MLRRLADMKIALALMGFLALAGCNKKNGPNGSDLVSGGGSQSAPGSVGDFQTNVGDRIYFLVDQSTLTPEAEGTLRRQAAWLKQYPNVTVQVEGHADERGTREYNIALSARRATVVREYITSQGVEPNRVTTIAYGKERPVALCDAESCWSQNRRAVTVVTGGAVGG